MKSLLEFLRLLNRPCRDMTALLSRAQDAKLTRRERFAARLHLLYCRACRRYVRHIRLLRAGLRAARDQLEQQAGIRLSREARERIEQRLDRGA